jgi:hypothetical protein
VASNPVSDEMRLVAVVSAEAPTERYRLGLIAASGYGSDLYRRAVAAFETA